MTAQTSAEKVRAVSLTIDGQEIVCPAGYTVYEAATANGIHIPTFCHHEKLVPVGACRMCLVEIEGVRALQTACTTLVQDGMVVRVHTSAAAVKARRANIEFLLTNHPLDCPVCDKGGECPLQDQAIMDGPGRSRYVEAKRHKEKRYPLSELIVLDQERCVLCWRCIRFLDEWADDHELDLFGRGAGTRIDTFPAGGLQSKWQGNTIDICPVGALTSRVFRFEARVWELSETSTVCPLCSVGCNIQVEVKNNAVRRIIPRENLAVNDAWVCDKGRFAHGFVDHRDRLTEPLVRRNGRLEPAPWQEALGLVAQRLGQMLEKEGDGRHGSGVVGALGSTRVTNEANYLLQRFMRAVIGSNNIDHLGRMPERVAPLASLPSLEEKDVVLLLECDPSTETPLVELWIKKAVLRHGARVLVANPRRIELARHAEAWLGYRPDTAATLLSGLARSILDRGPATSGGGSTTRPTNSEEFQSWLKPYGPDDVERLTGVLPSSLQRAAQILAEATDPVILYGPGLVGGKGRGTSPLQAGMASFDALENLALLLGGGEASFVATDNNTLGALQMGVAPHLYPGRLSLTDQDVRSRLASFWGAKLSPVPGLDLREMMAAACEGDLQGLWIMGADPAQDYPGARAALAQIPFLVVQDLFMTETAALAEVVLPAASFAETEGSFTNLTGRLQAIRPAKRAPGQAQADWRILTEVARLMVGERRARATAVWDFAGPGDVLSEIAKVVPGYRDLTYAAMGDTGWQPQGLASGRRVATRRAFVQVDAEQIPQQPEYPLVLATGHVLYDRGTLLRHSDTVQGLVPTAFAQIHPADAERLGLIDGEQVSVISEVGAMPLLLRVSDGVAPGTAFVPWNLSEPPVSALFAEPGLRPRVRIEK
jgi:NADH-quinone oxidoreductase chain G